MSVPAQRVALLSECTGEITVSGAGIYSPQDCRDPNRSFGSLHKLSIELGEVNYTQRHQTVDDYCLVDEKPVNVSEQITVPSPNGTKKLVLHPGSTFCPGDEGAPIECEIGSDSPVIAILRHDVLADGSRVIKKDFAETFEDISHLVKEGIVVGFPYDERHHVSDDSNPETLNGTNSTNATVKTDIRPGHDSERHHLPHIKNSMFRFFAIAGIVLGSCAAMIALILCSQRYAQDSSSPRGQEINDFSRP